ncbi:MAG: hypothetical protein ILO34_02770, partial [Kiritimatiellae bacterium]|nr:hypothetical protein [Kiritimatiellia bacterium]
PSGNGRTEKQTMSADEIKKKLGEGYRPGTKTQLAESEEQRCISLIQKAFYDKWDQVGRPAWTADLKAMVLRVKFGPGGRVAGYSLAVSSGDKKADNTVLKAANLVKAIGGLSDEFIARNKDGVDVRFKVTP